MATRQIRNEPTTFTSNVPQGNVSPNSPKERAAQPEQAYRAIEPRPPPTPTHIKCALILLR